MILKGRKVLVTGASRGIGREMAKALLAQGADVWGTSRDISQIRWPDGLVPVSLDLGSSSSVEQAWHSQGLSETAFDVVVNNAGSCRFGAFADSSFPDWERDIQALLLGTMKLCHLALPDLAKRGGFLVNVTSMASEFPIPFASGYNAAKAALVAFSESLAIENASSSLNVIDLRLGDFRTGFNELMERPEALSQPEERVWQTMVQRARRSPDAKRAAQALIKALRRDKSGLVRAGSIFQRAIAPFFARFSSSNLQRYANKSYYNL